MKRIRILHRLALLAALLLTAAEAGAQLVQYEYWFDRGFARRQTVSLSGSTATIRTAIDTQQLDDGVHTLHLRVKQSDGAYSPVTSSTFLKFKAQEGTVLEYWFDDNVDSRATVALANTDGQEQQVVLDLSDNKRFPIGLHRLNYRVAANGSNYSPIYGDNVMKTTSGEVCRLEYWFDEDFEHRAVADMAPLALMDNFSLELNLQNRTQFPQGQHRLNMRVVADDSHYSPVYSTWLLDVAAGSPTTLQYWVDDDYENARTLSGTQAGKNVLHDAEIDLGSTSPGFHRLNYRATSNSRKTNSPVATMPVMVRSRYNVEEQSVKVDGYRLTVDGGTPSTYSVYPPANTVEVPYTLDARSLADGNHTVQVQFSNSFDLWSNTAEATFVHQAPEAPTLTLQVTEENGLVTLKYNSVPNDIQSRILRKEVGGARAIVADYTASMYPNTVTATDLPPVGSFTYRAVAAYTDAEGKRQTVQSEEVPVTITAAAQKPRYVDIVGEVTMKGHNLWTMPAEILAGTVHFSDGTDVKLNRGSTRFSRTNVEVGTEFDIWLKQGAYVSKPCHIIVKDEKENKVQLEIEYDENFTQKVIDNSNYELAFVGERKPWTTPYEFGFRLKNQTSKDWTGTVRVRALSKKEYENPPSPKTDGNQLPTYAMVGAGSTVGTGIEALNATTPQTIEQSVKVSLLKGAEQDYEVFFSGFPAHKKAEDYYFVFESIRRGDDGTTFTKPVAPTQDFTNPMLLTMPAGNEASIDFEEEVKACVDITMGTLNHITQIDGILGKVDDYSKKVISTGMDMYGTETWSRLMYLMNTNKPYVIDPEMEQFLVVPEDLSAVAQFLRGDIADLVRKTKSAKKYLGYVKEFLGYWDTFVNIYHLNDETDNVTLCLQLMKMTAEKAMQGNPFAQLLDTYFDVGGAMASTILNKFGQTYFESFFPDYLKENVNSNYTDPDHCNNFINFAIKIQKSNLFRSYFDFDTPESTAVFKRIILHASQQTTENKVALFEFTPIANGKEVILKQIDRPDFKASWDNLDSDIQMRRLWLEVQWSNGRISKYPLNLVDVVKFANPYKMTLTLQSGSSSFDHIADVIAIPNE